jgi:hypothetical protein
MAEPHITKRKIACDYYTIQKTIFGRKMQFMMLFQQAETQRA